MRLICMAFDGDYVTEGRGFDSVEAAWERADDMGSRWYFYPYCFVTTDSGQTIKAAVYPLDCFEGKRVSTVVKTFEKVAAAPEAQNMDVDAFAAYVYHSI